MWGFLLKTWIVSSIANNAVQLNAAANAKAAQNAPPTRTGSMWDDVRAGRGPKPTPIPVDPDKLPYSLRVKWLWKQRNSALLIKAIGFYLVLLLTIIVFTTGTRLDGPGFWVFSVTTLYGMAYYFKQDDVHTRFLIEMEAHEKARQYREKAKAEYEAKQKQGFTL